MPPPAIIENSEAEIFGSKILNRNNHKVVISTVKSPDIDYSNGKESDSGSDNGTIFCVPPKILDISEVKILGSNISNRGILPTIELPLSNYSNGEESDSNSDDETVFHIDNKAIELIGCQKNFTTAAMNIVKKPFRQTMSTASDTSTSSNESYNLKTDDHNLWIGSSTSSESECEDNLKDIEQQQKKREDKTMKFVHIVKNSEPKIMNTLDDVENLSLQTSKLNINFSINNEKHFIDKESKLSKNLPAKNYHHTFQNDESEDSESSDNETDNEAEKENWRARGKWSKKDSTETNLNPKNMERISYRKSKATIDHKPLTKLCGMNETAFGTDFEKTTRSQSTINTFPGSWCFSETGFFSGGNDHYMINQDPIADSSSTVQEYTKLKSFGPAYSDYSPFSSHDSPQSAEGYHSSLSNGDCEEIFRPNSRESHQHYRIENSDFSQSTTNDSQIYFPTTLTTNVQSNNALDNLNDFRDFNNPEYPHSISEMNSNNVPKIFLNNMTNNLVTCNQKCQVKFEYKNILPIEDNERINNGMDPLPTMTAFAQPNLPPNNVPQINSVKLSENPHELDQILEGLVDMQYEKLDRQMNFNRANVTVSSNTKMLSQAQFSSCISKTPEVNQLNSGILNTIQIPPTNTAIYHQVKNNSTTVNINGSSGTGGSVTVNESDNYKKCIQQIVLFLRSDGDSGNNTEELEQTSNGIQAPTTRKNYPADEQNCNFRRNIVELSNTLIPLPVNEKSQSVTDKKLKKKTKWSFLDLPDTRACEQLKKMSNFRWVQKYEHAFIQLGKEKFEAHEKTGDTFLMTIVRNPKMLKNYLDCLMPLVGRMLHYSKSLMTKNKQGHDALYLAAINCPEFPYVTGYLAATIEKFYNQYDLKFNTYNQKNDTLMHVIAAQGDSHLPIMKELLAIRKERGCDFFDPSAQNSDGKTPLHLAVEANNPSKESLKMVQLLMENGADIRIKDNKEGNTALHTAISHAHSKSIVQAEVCRYLVDDKSPTNIPNNYNKMPLALVAPERRKIIENIFRKKC